ncbi:hypothetical protein NG895_00170 [Aeoliella sp. ICT_H6.2]|uniref:Uncharacterized protein n=1 Tax=Aeoliella straminimaris TaxID=2954799 RepID=A0A9X2F628_9BACT|nr:hypothetical protein [Aeoliella straminimaris]MCO6042308.1 hypothetical protein [Aeoliella straminimaris]
MRHSITAALERHRDYTQSFATEPYECAWATEAIFFIRVQELEGENPALQARVQVSPDGIHWADEGTEFQRIDQLGVSFVRVTHFGGWLRLEGSVEGEQARFNVNINLVLK